MLDRLQAHRNVDDELVVVVVARVVVYVEIFVAGAIVVVVKCH